MALPKPENLVNDIALAERALGSLETQFAARISVAATPDGRIVVQARGDVSLEEVDIDHAEFAAMGPTPAPDILASFTDRILTACAKALNLANAASAQESSANAAAYTLTGLPGPGFPPPSDDGFDVAAGHAIAIAPGIMSMMDNRDFLGERDGVKATVHGSLELCDLQLPALLPQTVSELEASVRTAINEALAKAKGLFEESAAKIISDEIQGVTRVLADARPSALLVVENAATLRPSDEVLRARLAGLGYAPLIKKGPDLVSADANGRALIVVSESVASGDIGTKLTNAAVPIIICEPLSFKDLKMTGTVDGTDYGTVSGHTSLAISGTHPLTAGVSGTVAVVSASSPFGWGKPGSAAAKPGAIVGKSNAWGIFAYDTGDAMFGMNAPARRIGWFLKMGVAEGMTANGWKLFDAAVRWAAGPRALITVKSTTLTAGDVALKQRLEQQHGMEVLVRTEGDTKTSDLKDLRVHVISDSVSSTAVAGRFTTSPAPTIVCDANLFDDMKLTGAVKDADYGELESLTELDIRPDTPITGCASGKTAVTDSPVRFHWGKPGVEAVKIAFIPGQTDQWGIFTYEGGAQMVGAVAAAPRVGFFASHQAMAAFTPAGAALFDYAVRWARRPRALLVVGNPASLGASDRAIRDRLAESFGFIVEIKSAAAVIDVHANGKKVIIVSESVASADVAGRLTNVAVPLVCLEPLLFDDLKMTGTQSNTDFGTVSNQTDLEVVLASHPLAGGLAAGRVTVSSAPDGFAWGKPSASASKVAHLVGKPDFWGIFGYETGASMVGATAPARRVGLYLGKLADTLNDSGLRTFDIAMQWAAGNLEVLALTENPGDAVAAIPSRRILSLWQIGVAYKVGDEVTYDGKDYRCRQAHTSQSDWTPPLTYALWERINPGSEWTVQVIYKVGDEVLYLGIRYRAIQQNQAVVSWEPPNTPALWQRIN